MSRKADAHMHLFKQGYADLLPENCRRTSPDDVTLYDALAKRASIVAALVVGYEGLPAYAGNNEYLASLRGKYAWLNPVAFIEDVQKLTIAKLERFGQLGFVGISLYLFDPTLNLGTVPPEIWEWLSDNRWLISVNSKGEHWLKWGKVLSRHPSLTLVISHLGLPDAQATEIPKTAAKHLMEMATRFAEFPSVVMKVTALYALAKPSFGWPHRAAWPFVECALDAFGANRLLWGSDYSPSLEHISFDQCCGVLDDMPFLSDADRSRVYGENLIHLLDEAKKKSASGRNR